MLTAKELRLDGWQRHLKSVVAHFTDWAALSKQEIEQSGSSETRPGRPDAVGAAVGEEAPVLGMVMK